MGLKKIITSIMLALSLSTASPEIANAEKTKIVKKSNKEEAKKRIKKRLETTERIMKYAEQVVDSKNENLRKSTLKELEREWKMIEINEKLIKKYGGDKYFRELKGKLFTLISALSPLSPKKI